MIEEEKPKEERMYLEESNPHLVPVLREYEGRVKLGIEQLCKVWWQEASPPMKRRYARFAMTRADYKRYSGAWGETTVRHLSNAKSIDIVAELVPDGSSANGLFGPRIAGGFLRRSSYALCLLGGTASPGDLEYLIRELERRYSWEGMEDGTPAERFERYRNGYGRDLSLFLNALLVLAADNFHALRTKRRAAASELRPFRLNERDGQFEVDHETIDTFYFPLLSILRVIEPVVGTA